MSPRLDFDSTRAPTIDEIRDAHRALAGVVRRTPCWTLDGGFVREVLGDDAALVLKLESFQHAGSFKVRAALLILERLAERSRRTGQSPPGVCAVSAGNHAIALAWAARRCGVRAKLVMMQNANPARVHRVRELGAELELVEDVHRAFERCSEIERDEGRFFVHPFEGPLTTLGTATLGLEWHEDAQALDARALDAIVVPIGGGGLMSGVATAFRALSPEIEIFGVEPEGADSMHRSFASGRPASIDAVRTIADSLGAPRAEPYSFERCRESVDALVHVSDAEIRTAMRLLWDEVALALEPAAAAATAAAIGPLATRLRDRRVGVLCCGSNIDAATLAAMHADAQA